MKRVKRITITCPVCGKSFLATERQLRVGRGKYCSMSCRSKIAILESIKSRGKSWLEKMSVLAKKRALIWKIDETKHPRWKGDEVGYFGVHDWITKHYGQPKKCEVCGLSDCDRKYHWANLSQKYKRDITDWKRMCVPCHRKYDYSFNNKNEH